MKYIQVQFVCDPDREMVKDVLAAMLADIGFETFEQVVGGLDAYLPAPLFSAKKIAELLAALPLEAHISWKHHELEDKNWNEEWEKHYFKPIMIGDDCYIHQLVSSS